MLNARKMTHETTKARDFLLKNRQMIVGRMSEPIDRPITIGIEKKLYPPKRLLSVGKIRKRQMATTPQISIVEGRFDSSDLILSSSASGNCESSSLTIFSSSISFMLLLKRLTHNG